MAAENSFSWRNVITLALFCVVAAFGGGIVVRNVLHEYAAWKVAGFAVAAGIFIAIFAVILMQVLSSLREQRQ